MSASQGLPALIIGFLLACSPWNPSFAEATNPLKTYSSPIVKLEPEKGFFLITTNSGILWVQVEDPGKALLKDLEVGDEIHVVVEERPDNAPAILKSWKLQRSGSSCIIFDGRACNKG